MTVSVVEGTMVANVRSALAHYGTFLAAASAAAPSPRVGLCALFRTPLTSNTKLQVRCRLTPLLQVDLPAAWVCRRAPASPISANPPHSIEQVKLRPAEFALRDWHQAVHKLVATPDSEPVDSAQAAVAVQNTLVRVLQGAGQSAGRAVEAGERRAARLVLVTDTVFELDNTWRLAFKVHLSPGLPSCVCWVVLEGPAVVPGPAAAIQGGPKSAAAASLCPAGDRGVRRGSGAADARSRWPEGQRAHSDAAVAGGRGAAPPRDAVAAGDDRWALRC